MNQHRQTLINLPMDIIFCFHNASCYELKCQVLMKTKYNIYDHTVKVKIANDLQNIKNLRWNNFSHLKYPGFYVPSIIG